MYSKAPFSSLPASSPPVPTVLEEDVLRALYDNRVFLHFQPVCRARAQTFIAFNEGLLRLRDDTGHTRTAGEFLPHITDPDVSLRLDRIALNSAVAKLSAQVGLRLAINISPSSLGDPVWMQTLRDATSSPHIVERLIVEITETDAIADPERSRAFMRDASRMGVSFALDDFGSGATSLRYLREFRFDIIKFDGFFVRNLATRPDNRAILEAMIHIARHFEMSTVAEFVETESDANCAASLGIDCLQGFGIGRPQASPVYGMQNTIRSQNRKVG